jgi:hypothetical protein
MIGPQIRGAHVPLPEGDLLPAYRAEERGLLPGGRAFRLDGQPLLNDEYELIGARGASVVRPDAGGGRDAAQRDDGGAAAVRALTVAGLSRGGRRLGIHEARL